MLKQNGQKKEELQEKKELLFHALKKREDINCKDKPVYFSETKDDIKPIRDLETLEDGIYPELTLYNE